MRDLNSRPPDYQSYILEVTQCMAACWYVLKRRWYCVGTRIKIDRFTLEVTQKHMAPSFFVSFEKGGMAGVINTFQVTFLEVTRCMAALVLFK